MLEVIILWQVSCGYFTDGIHERRTVICDLILWSDGVKANNIYRCMTVTYGDNCMSYRKVCGWIKKMKGREISIVVDDVHSE